MRPLSIKRLHRYYIFFWLQIRILCSLHFIFRCYLILLVRRVCLHWGISFTFCSWMYWCFSAASPLPSQFFLSSIWLYLLTYATTCPKPFSLRGIFSSGILCLERIMEICFETRDDNVCVSVVIHIAESCLLKQSNLLPFSIVFRPQGKSDFIVV